MSKKVLFIDRDGTLIEEPADFQIDSFHKLAFLPQAISSLAKIALEMDFVLVMVTNQDGLGTDSFPEEDFWPVQNLVMAILASEGILFEDVFIDSSYEEDQSPSRKPGTAMLNKYLYGDYDLANSYVIGDRLTDLQLAKNLGTQAIFISENATSSTPLSLDAALTTKSWDEIHRFLKKRPRKATESRTTLETQIHVALNLDGQGKSSIDTGIPFFDHMLEQISKHGNMDLSISVKGDLEIDEHHTIEDTGLALGDAFRKALGDKKAIERYGFVLPMDDCLAQVALDFGGRPWFQWKAQFKREKVGDLPTEMVEHFFKSFSDQARCNLAIHVEGDNEHHKIESIFKAFARTLKMAVRKTNNFAIPSTKGTL